MKDSVIIWTLLCANTSYLILRDGRLIQLLDKKYEFLFLSVKMKVWLVVHISINYATYFIYMNSDFYFVKAS
jgi:hypothetical protein